MDLRGKMDISCQVKLKILIKVTLHHQIYPKQNPLCSCRMAKKPFLYAHGFWLLISRKAHWEQPHQRLSEPNGSGSPFLLLLFHPPQELRPISAVRSNPPQVQSFRWVLPRAPIVSAHSLASCSKCLKILMWMWISSAI